MEDTTYGIRTEVKLPYEKAIESTTAALKDEGFGVLTTIDVKDTLKKKLDVDFRRYVILGACNPSIAHRALQAETELGLLLPCNVVVYEADSGDSSVVAVMAPLVALGIIDNAELHQAAKEADQRLRRAMAALEKQFG